MSLKDLITAVKNDLPITVRHERWLAANRNATYSPEAIEFARLVLSGQIGGQRERKLDRSFRASGMGKCKRRRIFDFLGSVPSAQNLTTKNINIFHTGSFLHLKWQMAGISAGWIASKDHAEVPFESEKLLLGGTSDGVVYDGSLLEIKTANDRNYTRSMKDGPDHSYLLQVGAYKRLNPDFEAVSFIYEDKDNGEWRERRFYFIDEIMAEVDDEIAELHSHLENKTLPKMRTPCVDQTGYEYRQCPYRLTCPEVSRWPGAK